jgi:uncharacterized membrane protein
VFRNFQNDKYVSGGTGWYTLALNEQGQNAALKALGFRQFLKDFTLVGERSSVEVSLWGDYLVNAAVFGIANKVAKEMSKIDPALLKKLPVSYTSLPDVVVFSDTFGRAIRSGMNSFYSSTYSGSGHSGSYGRGSYGGWGGSSSSGGGGGFSGGGHGGGSR